MCAYFFVDIKTNGIWDKRHLLDCSIKFVSECLSNVGLFVYDMGLICSFVFNLVCCQRTNELTTILYTIVKTNTFNKNHTDEWTTIYQVSMAYAGFWWENVWVALQDPLVVPRCACVNSSSNGLKRHVLYSLLPLLHWMQHRTMWEEHKILHIMHHLVLLKVIKQTQTGKHLLASCVA